MGSLLLPDRVRLHSPYREVEERVDEHDRAL
jgi:hypothetical protein